jgi:hypothetical protein
MKLDHQRAGAAALLIGVAISIVLMLFHPSHGMAPALLFHLTASDLVHGAALFSAPLLVYGHWRLTCFVGADRPSAALALSFYAFGAVAVMIAATISGLVSTSAIEAAHTAQGADREVFGKIAHLSVWLNRGFAAVHIGLFSVATVLYALAWPARGVVGQLFKLSGYASGIGVLGWLLSGALHIGVPSMVIVVVTQGFWPAIAACVMLRSPNNATNKD